MAFPSYFNLLPNSYAKAIDANSPAAHTRSFYDSPSSYTPAAAHTPHTPYNPVGRRPIVNQPYSVDASYYFQVPAHLA